MPDVSKQHSSTDSVHQQMNEQNTANFERLIAENARLEEQLAVANALDEKHVAERDNLFEQLEARERERDEETQVFLTRTTELKEQLEATKDAARFWEESFCDVMDECYPVDAQQVRIKRAEEQLEANEKWMEGARECIEQLETMRELNRRAEERCADAVGRLRVAHRYLLEDGNGQTDEAWYYEALRATDITASFPASEPKEDA